MEEEWEADGLEEAGEHENGADPEGDEACGGEEGGEGDDEFACDEPDVKKRRLHVRVTCDQQVKKKERREKTVGEICRITTDSLKRCLEHHIVAEAERCRVKFEKVLECQKSAAELGAAG